MTTNPTDPLAAARLLLQELEKHGPAFEGYCIAPISAEASKLLRAAVNAIDGIDLREGHIRDNADPDRLREMLLGAGLKLAAKDAEIERLRGALEVFASGTMWEQVEGMVFGPDCPDGHNDPVIWLGADNPAEFAQAALAVTTEPDQAAGA